MKTLVKPAGKKENILAVKVSIRDAEAAKRFLSERKLIVKDADLKAVGKNFYIPISTAPASMPCEFTTCRMAFLTKGPANLRQALEEKHLLPDGVVLRSFDVVGDIAIVDIPKELEKKKTKIAGELLRLLAPRVKVVAMRASKTEGEFRIRKIKVLAGEKRTTTLYRENGCAFKIDINKAYFSPRLSFERSRVASLTKPGEKVLCLFAGVGPFAIEMEKRGAHVVAVELNPLAVELMRENVRLNKCRNIEVIEGDAAAVMAQPRFRRWADRIAMPLPKDAFQFLVPTVKAAASGATVHFYSFGNEIDDGGPFEKARKQVADACRKAGRKCRILVERRVKPFAPKVTQVVIDFKTVD